MVIGEDGFEECAKLEVVLLQEGVIFVIMATGALEAESEKHVGGGIGDFCEDEVPLAAGITIVVFVDPVSEESSGHECCGIFGKEFVSGELFLEKAVVGLVLVERLDHVVAVAPGIGAVEICAVAVGVGIANEIKPDAGPALAVGGALEELIDELFPCVGTVVAEEGFDLLGSWGEAGDFERESSEKREAVGLRSGLEVLASHGLEQEAVNLVAAP